MAVTEEGPAPRMVLVIDDDETIRELIVWRLRRAGYDTMVAGDGQAGLAAATAPAPQRRPDLVLLDWMLPKMSGVEVCRAIRAHPAGAAVPVIMLSGRGDAAQVEAGRAAGADDYLLKPFTPDDLLERVEAQLARLPRSPR